MTKEERDLARTFAPYLGLSAEPSDPKARDKYRRAWVTIETVSFLRDVLIRKFGKDAVRRAPDDVVPPECVRLARALDDAHWDARTIRDFTDNQGDVAADRIAQLTIGICDGDREVKEGLAWAVRQAAIIPDPEKRAAVAAALAAAHRALCAAATAAAGETRKAEDDSALRLARVAARLASEARRKASPPARFYLGRDHGGRRPKTTKANRLHDGAAAHEDAAATGPVSARGE